MSCRTTCPASAIPTISYTARPKREASCSADTRPTPWQGGSTACRGRTPGPRSHRTRHASSGSWPGLRGGFPSSARGGMRRPAAPPARWRPLLHTRMQDLAAVFGAKHGWERPEYLEPVTPCRRAGADQRRFGWKRPPYFSAVAEEHAAFRERVGIIDMSSFGKIEISGPGALPLLERVAGNLLDKPAGTVVYTQLLEKDGGMAADVTITR